MALKNKQHNFWTTWNFRILPYHLRTAPFRYFYSDPGSCVPWNAAEIFSAAFLLREDKEKVQLRLHDGTNLSFSLLLTVGQCARNPLLGFTNCSHPECSQEATGGSAAPQIPSPCKPPGQSTPSSDCLPKSRSEAPVQAILLHQACQTFPLASRCLNKIFIA